MRQKLAQFMRGRYGVDKLNQFLVWGGLIILLVFQLFTGVPNVGFILAVAMMGYCYFRMFSKNYEARYKENQSFLKLFNPAARRCRIKWKQLKDFKSYKYFTCPKCGQSIRVPRKKGNISIRCSKCRQEFAGKT